MKFYAGVEHGPVTNLFNFGGDPDRYADAETVLKNIKICI